ncbi:hypothetical protein EGR_05785 [Echinococcus granulosus]|uniref:Uncharacterized protein n=1 Tax=Echinococcus granulosus TaxID=6210 RepID=W6UEG2_ECHGR|nr:hypothetical protein EGR_05785 [Echinococcus granulosus]EUB59301.1 hypothetical protein EGR_05785 [Echinococcus granulosus]
MESTEISKGRKGEKKNNELKRGRVARANRELSAFHMGPYLMPLLGLGLSSTFNFLLAMLSSNVDFKYTLINLKSCNFNPQDKKFEISTSNLKGQGSDSSLKTMNTKKKQPLLFMRFQYDVIRIRDKSMIAALRLRENQPSHLNDKAREKATLDWQAFTIEDRFKRLYINTCNNIYIHPRQN